MKYEIKQIFDADKGTISIVSCTPMSEQPVPTPTPDPTPTPTPDPTPPPILDLTQSVNVPTAAKVGDSVTVGAAWVNTNAVPFDVEQLVIAVRQPGSTPEGGPFDQDINGAGALSIASKASSALNGTFKPSKAGAWMLYPTYKTKDGKWHDGRAKTVNVAEAVPTPNPTPTPTPTVQPPPVTSPQPPNPGTFTHQLGKSRLGAQTWFVDSWGNSNPFLPAAQWSGTNIWNEQWFADFKALGLTCIRQMDSNSTNWSKITSWSQRTQPGKFHNAYSDPGSPANTTGIAIEYQIEMANKANADLWVTHPFLANDDYFTQEAKLIKANLKPGLRVFIELSNEVWNGQFAQFGQANSAGVQGKLPGMNQYYQGIAYEMKRALEMFQLYQNVFGQSAMGSKIIRTFCESGDFGLTTEALKTVYKSAQWNPNSQKIDMLACAPYVERQKDGSATTISSWNSALDKDIGDEIKPMVNQAAQYGIPYTGFYEFGSHHSVHADTFGNKSLAYDAYMNMFNKYMSLVNGVCCHYTLHSDYKPDSAWGLFNKVGQDINTAPKARAVRDWNKANRG